MAKDMAIESVADGSRTIERREFLSAGAALGATAYLGPSETGPAALPPGKARAENCAENRSTLAWAIPAPHLNALWTGLWPRMAARIWHDPNLDWPQVSDSSTGTLLDIGDTLRIWIESFLGTSNVPGFVSTPQQALRSNDPGPSPQQYGGVPTSGSVLFQQQLKDLHAYLGETGRAPIYYLGEGAYDFLLSERGLELWAPPNLADMPDPQQELLDAYEYRRTGRSPLAVPSVMGGAVRLPEAPTGPGQLEAPLDLAVLGDLCLDTSTGSLLGYCGVPEGAREWADRLENRLREDSDDRRLTESEALAAIRRTLAVLGASTEDVRMILDTGSILEALDRFRRWIVRDLEAQREQNRTCVPLPPDLYLCGALATRCWVVTGAVYRGILEQFPRAVADHWADNPSSSVTAPGNFVPREECERRIEVRLPPDSQMLFDFLPSTPPTVLNQILQKPALWDTEHLIVTNMGFVFPADIGAAGQAPTADDMLGAIATGNAGNPIFTDTAASL